MFFFKNLKCSTLSAVKSNGFFNFFKVKSNCKKVKSNGKKVKSNGKKVKSNGKKSEVQYPLDFTFLVHLPYLNTCRN